MGLKGLLGFCECKGCRNRMEYEMDIITRGSDGTKKVKTARICGKHAIEQMKMGELKSVTVENTINF